jgi:hypothetical protein
MAFTQLLLLLFRSYTDTKKLSSLKETEDNMAGHLFPERKARTKRDIGVQSFSSHYLQLWDTVRNKSITYFQIRF